MNNLDSLIQIISAVQFDKASFNPSITKNVNVERIVQKTKEAEYVSYSIRIVEDGELVEAHLLDSPEEVVMFLKTRFGG